MRAFLKWFFASVLAGLVWLVARYTQEQARPYQKFPASLRDR